MIRYRDKISVEEYNQLRGSVDWRILEAKQAERGLNNSAYCIAAYDEEMPIGFARVISDGGYMSLIADVMVRPEYQKRGIGSEMIKRIISTLENSLDSEEILMINLMAVPGKERFYSKFGFIERPNETMGAGMVRWLNL